MELSEENQEIILFEEEHVFPVKKLNLLSKQYRLASLADPVVIAEIVEAVKNFYRDLENPRKGVRKITAHHFRIALGNSRLLDEEVAAELKAALNRPELEPAQRKQLWESCSAKLQYAMLKTSQDTFDYELYGLMELEPVYISRTFLALNALGAPVKKSYSTSYLQLDYDTGEKLVHYLNGVPREDLREVLRIIDPRVMYLIAVEEMKKYIEDNSYFEDFYKKLFLALDPDYRDTVPPDLPFLSWLQQCDLEVFNDLVAELNNQSHDEFRDMFHAERRRFGGARDADDVRDDFANGRADQYLDDLFS